MFENDVQPTAAPLDAPHVAVTFRFHFPGEVVIAAVRRLCAQVDPALWPTEVIVERSDEGVYSVAFRVSGGTPVRPVLPPRREALEAVQEAFAWLPQALGEHQRAHPQGVASES